MAGKNIKLNPDETLGHVSKIAETMAEASVPGPVPPPSAPTSPIDVALNAVVAAAAEKAAGVLRSACRPRHSSTTPSRSRPSAAMQAQEEENAARITEIQSQVPEAGITEV